MAFLSGVWSKAPNRCKITTFKPITQMDDINKQFDAFYQKAKSVINTFPVLAANEGVNFFQDSFRHQGFAGETQQTWKKRKTDKNKHDTGRAILVKSGRLKRSIRRMRADWQAVIVGTDVAYAQIHNEGFRGTQTVKEQSRIGSRLVSTRLKKDGTFSKSKSALRRIKTKGFQVKSHTRKMNMPKRQFIGNSPFLNARIERLFILKLNQL